METNNIRKTNKNTNPNLKKLPCNQHGLKTLELPGKQCLYSLKAEQEAQLKKKHTKNKANIKTERQKHKTWNQKQKQQKTLRNNQTWKQLGFQKGNVRKVCLKEISKDEQRQRQQIKERQKNPPK